MAQPLLLKKQIAFFVTYEPQKKEQNLGSLMELINKGLVCRLIVVEGLLSTAGRIFAQDQEQDTGYLKNGSIMRVDIANY